MSNHTLYLRMLIALFLVLIAVALFPIGAVTLVVSGFCEGFLHYVERLCKIVNTELLRRSTLREADLCE